MGRIEILNENGQLELLYFKIPKEIMLHWKAPLIEKVREEILTQIKLENPEEKVRSFLDLSEKLVLAVYHQANIAKIKDYVPMIGWMLYLFVSNRKFFNILSMVLSLGLNIVMVNVIVGPKKECPQEVQQNLIKFCPTEPYETWNNSVEEGLFVIFAWINAVVFSIILLDHCINNMNLNIMEYMQREKEREQKIKDLGLMSAEQWTYSWTSYIYGFLGVSILDPMFIFLFLITLASYYGIYYHAWLCVCLAIPITENATLRKVIDAAVGHWD